MEDANHFFLVCPRYAGIRPALVNGLAGQAAINIRTILFGKKDAAAPVNSRIFELAQNFIRDSGRFV
jgi:hypothetical protein